MGRKKYRPYYSLELLKAGLGKDLLHPNFGSELLQLNDTGEHLKTYHNFAHGRDISDSSYSNLILQICKGGNPTNFPCHLFWGITVLMSNVNLMLGLKFLYCLLFPLSTERPFNSFRPPYGLSEGLCTTQATLLFVHASTARNVVAYAPLEVHYSLLLLLHRAATDPDGPHPTCLQLVALSSPALSSLSSRASHFSSLSWSFLKSRLVPQHSHCPSQHHRWCHPQLH